jgi:hypothetical protein
MHPRVLSKERAIDQGSLVPKTDKVQRARILKWKALGGLLGGMSSFILPMLLSCPGDKFWI